MQSLIILTQKRTIHYISPSLLLVYSLSYFIVAGFLLEIRTVLQLKYMIFHPFTCFFTIYGYTTNPKRGHLYFFKCSQEKFDNCWCSQMLAKPIRYPYSRDKQILTKAAKKQIIFMINNLPVKNFSTSLFASFRYVLNTLLIL